MRPHRRQPTRLPSPWDSPGKSTGVGCHFFLQCMRVKSESELAQSCKTPSDPMDRSLPGSSVHGIFQAGILEWVAISSSSGSSHPRDRTHNIPCIAGRFFTAKPMEKPQNTLILKQTWGFMSILIVPYCLDIYWFLLHHPLLIYLLLTWIQSRHTVSFIVEQIRK